jgi:small subunit ribosomal protein S21
MLIIPVKEGENIERALKRYKKKFEKTEHYETIARSSAV